MATSDPARQFIMIPFRDLDSPAFMRLARSPQFSTYLTLRRYIWRSSQRHSRNLHEWYARGYLCSGLSRARIVQCLGGEVSIRSVCSDIARLVQHKVIEVSGAGRQQVFILGRWRKNGDDYIEHYYLDRLAPAEANQATNCAVPATDAQPCTNLRDSPPTTCRDAAQQVAQMNRELLNRECTIEAGSSYSKSDTAIWKEVLDELRLQLLRSTFGTWVSRTTARRVEGRWEITCANALAQDWMEGRLGNIIRRELAAAAGEEVGEVVFRTKASSQQPVGSSEPSIEMPA